MRGGSWRLLGSHAAVEAWARAWGERPGALAWGRSPPDSVQEMRGVSLPICCCNRVRRRAQGLVLSGAPALQSKHRYGRSSFRLANNGWVLFCSERRPGAQRQSKLNTVVLELQRQCTRGTQVPIASTQTCLRPRHGCETSRACFNWAQQP